MSIGTYLCEQSQEWQHKEGAAISPLQSHFWVSSLSFGYKKGPLLQGISCYKYVVSPSPDQLLMSFGRLALFQGACPAALFPPKAIVLPQSATPKGHNEL